MLYARAVRKQHVYQPIRKICKFSDSYFTMGTAMVQISLLQFDFLSVLSSVHAIVFGNFMSTDLHRHILLNNGLVARLVSSNLFKVLTLADILVNYSACICAEVNIAIRCLVISIRVNRSSYHRKLTFRFAMTTTSNDYDSTFKILVLGDSGVGKTCLIYRYTEGIFSEAYVSTIGEFILNFQSELIQSLGN